MLRLRVRHAGVLGVARQVVTFFLRNPVLGIALLFFRFAFRGERVATRLGISTASSPLTRRTGIFLDRLRFDFLFSLPGEIA
jgi:hypothetical protein